MKLSTSLYASILAALYASIALGAPIAHEEIATKSRAGQRLISVQDGVDPVWKTETEVLDLIKQHVNFVDVTDAYEVDSAYLAKRRKLENLAFPAPSHQTQVKAIISTLTIASMQSYLTTLTSYNNRYYKATTDVSASNWIYDTLTSIASGSSGITVTQFI